MKRLLKIVLKTITISFAIVVVIFFTLLIVYSDDTPKGTPGEKADALAYNMLEALNYEKFKQAKALQWTFRGKNTYKWNLQENVVEVQWDNFKVTYYTKNRERSTAFLNGDRLLGEAREEALSYAIDNFNNDSFWVVAPFKAFDSGTTRSIVQEDSKQKLLVQYSIGGTTPGDAYLWELDETYKPVAFKMWVSILPFEGLEAEWSEWEMTEGDFMLSYQKSIFGLEVPVTNLKVIP